jgi:hypothetical protein
MSRAHEMTRANAGTTIPSVSAVGISPGGDRRLSLCTSILEMQK